VARKVGSYEEQRIGRWVERREGIERTTTETQGERSGETVERWASGLCFGFHLQVNKIPRDALLIMGHTHTPVWLPADRIGSIGAFNVHSTRNHGCFNYGVLNEDPATGCFEFRLGVLKYHEDSTTMARVMHVCGLDAYLGHVVRQRPRYGVAFQTDSFERRPFASLNITATTAAAATTTTYSNSSNRIITYYHEKILVAGIVIFIRTPLLLTLWQRGRPGATTSADSSRAATLARMHSDVVR